MLGDLWVAFFSGVWVKRGIAGFPVDYTTAIAGKPAPTGICVDQGFVNDTDHCGSGLARDGADTAITRLSVRPLNKHCLNDTSRYSLRLHILAPLPTTAPESAGLCALGPGSIVCLSLKNSERVW